MNTSADPMPGTTDPVSGTSSSGPGTTGSGPGTTGSGPGTSGRVPGATMRAALLTAPRALEPRARLAVPRPGPGELLVQVLASGICGSDLAAYRGTHPYKVAPVVLGHEFCGTVVQAEPGPGAGEFAVGDLVCSAAFSPCDTCAECRRGAPNLCTDRRNLSHEGWQGSFAQYVLLRPNMTHRLPPGTDPVAGALVEPLSIGLHAVRLAGAGNGRRLAVLGSGTIGLSCLLSARRLGFGPAVCVDAGPAKAALASAVGADGYVDARTDAPSPARVGELVAARLGGERPDLVVVSAGYPGVLDQAVATVRPGGTIVVVSYFEAPVPTDLNALVGREARVLFSSLSGPGDFRQIIAWLADGSLDPLPLVTHHFPLDRIEEAMNVLENPAPPVPGAPPTGKVMLSIGAGGAS